MFVVRHWGVLIAAVGALIVFSAYVPAMRAPVLVAAAAEKFAIGLLVVLGRQKRTAVIKAIALMDGFFAVLYVVYLAGQMR